MLRLAVAVLLALLVTEPLSAGTQHKSRARSGPPTAPGTTTLTSFDTNHTVIGWLEIVPFESKIYHSQCTLRVLVPANYLSPHNAHRSYPVLYMLGGANLFDQASAGGGEWHTDETVEHLVGSFHILPMFVIGIESPADEKNVSDKEYVRFVMTEAIPFVEKWYRISRGTANTGIGGGGAQADLALYTALEHPSSFGHVLLDSPPMGDSSALREMEKAKVLPRKIYIGFSGTEGAAEKDVQELERVLRKKGMTAARLKIDIEQGGRNDVAAWSSRLPDALLFLYGK